MTTTVTGALTEQGRASTADEMAVIRLELARVDAKASTLVGLDGAGLLFAATSANSAPMAAKVLLLAVAVTLAFSATFALLALRPRFGPTGLCRWRQMILHDLAAAMNGRQRGDSVLELKFMSQLTYDKFRALRWSVNAIFVAVALLVTAVVAGVIA
ncbi:MAG: Pycsar system effector family protein [Arthrobacter sp.]|uniref:Pycsar system effector family protein n=1 Tax=Arthrobacter sp. TaxID=1667 RepID=UPI0034993574